MANFNVGQASTVNLPRSQSIRNGAVFRSVPVSGRLQASVGNDGNPVFTCPNSVVLPPEVIQAIQRNAKEVWFPLKGDLKLPGVKWIVNTMADADDYAPGLKLLQQIIGPAKIPVFNHPTEVMKTRRSNAQQLFGDIEGLKVPKCTAFMPKHPDDFQSHFEEEGYEYPVLVRPSGFQTGKDLIRVSGPEDWELVHRIQWAGKPNFMTQFVDFRGENGRYTKVRVMMTGGQFNLRSVVQNVDWEIRGDASHSGEEGGKILPEESALKWKNLVRIATEISQRVDLDLFGIDLGAVDENNFVFFEATAAMTSTRWDGMSVRKRKRYEPLLRAFNRNVLKCAAAKGIPVSVPM